jgi:hypothetical protein
MRICAISLSVEDLLKSGHGEMEMRSRMFPEHSDHVKNCPIAERCSSKMFCSCCSFFKKELQIYESENFNPEGSDLLALDFFLVLK